ncbi:MAG: hypothetical protein Q8Q48_01440, partial [Candidatus Staskawiczbacteria bacterium]|nr:hypothetical protein [Candidatus Staskawiczbacteria bacterium]
MKLNITSKDEEVEPVRKSIQKAPEKKTAPKPKAEKLTTCKKNDGFLPRGKKPSKSEQGEEKKAKAKIEKKVVAEKKEESRKTEVVKESAQKAEPIVAGKEPKIPARNAVSIAPAGGEPKKARKEGEYSA